MKKDSITEQNLTDATFTLYEWNGSQYVEKETIRDENQDGIYETNTYEWSKTTGGKYKLVETGIPQNHKNLNFSMEYTINQLTTGDYIITPDYDNNSYRITYGIRTPDDFDRQNGVVENEPYKVKTKIEKIDSQTKKQIVQDASFTIYEWNNQTNQYQEYISKTNGQKVEMKRQEDGTYLSSQWLYYTKQNEGRYRIIETKAPQGYGADYENIETKQKRTYDLNIKEIVETRKLQRAKRNKRSHHQHRKQWRKIRKHKSTKQN